MSAERKILVLRSFAKGPKKVEEVVAETGVPQSSVYRIVRSLRLEKSLETAMGRFALTTAGRQRYSGQLEN